MARRSRREWEPLFKAIVCPVFTEAGAEVRSGVQVGARELEIDLEVRCGPEARAVLAATSPFDFFVDVNLLEAKLMDDWLTVREFQRAVGRAWLFLSGNAEFRPRQVQTVALSSRRPRALLAWLSENMAFDRIAEGHYLVDIQPAFHILSLVELPLEAGNLLLTLFSVGRRRTAVINELLRRRATAHIRTAYELYPEDVREAIRVSEARFSLDRNIRFIINDLGREKVLRHYTPEEWLEGLPEDVLLKAIPPEKYIERLSPEELARLRKLLNGE